MIKIIKKIIGFSLLTMLFSGLVFLSYLTLHSWIGVAKIWGVVLILTALIVVSVTLIVGD